MGRISKLTDMQKKFVEFLVYGDPKSGEPLNQTEAAKLAGYAPESARVEGSQLCNPKLSPLVVAYKRQLEHERLQKHEVTHIGHVSRLNELGRKAEKEISNKEWNERTGKKLDMLKKLNDAGKFKKDFDDERLQGWVDQNYSWEKLSRQFKVNEVNDKMFDFENEVD